MAENKNMVVDNVTPPEEQKEKKVTWAKFKAGLKERCRKFIVNLKRRPSNIAFVFLLITSLVYLFAYTNIAQYLYAVRSNDDIINWSGLCSFVSFLFSILVFVLYMQTFPKRKKMNVVMLVLTYIFLAVMVFADVVCYLEACELDANTTSSVTSYLYTSIDIWLAHIVLICITAVVLACTPLIKMGLMKINTRKEVDSSEFKGQLDLENVEE